jgi:mannose-1-phosphate guanylyltransferase
MLTRQLHGVELIMEPSRRDTYAAVVLTAAYLKYVKGLPEGEGFLVLPIDVYAESRYFELLTDVMALVETGGYSIGLLGAEPTHPTNKYGYIQHGNGRAGGFTEKPSISVAETLIRNGALWNCGVFALKIGYVLDLARKQVDFDSYESIYDKYGELPKISFDYEVAEKEPSIGVIRYTGTWKDLGTWNTLTDEMDSRVLGSGVILAEDGDSVHVLNMLDIPVISLGIRDAVIVASRDGILIAGKEASARLKPHAEQIALRPMYEQRRWGSYRVLEYRATGGGTSLVKRLHIEAGKSISYQYHSGRSEVWVIVSGKGILTVDGVDSAVSPGSVVSIPAGARHKLLAATALDFIEVQSGPGDMTEEDIVRVDE